MKKTGQIYIIYCLATGKAYVGQTIFTYDIRWRQHCQASRRNKGTGCKDLYAAIQSYGREQFICLPIIRAESKKQLNDLEMQLIKDCGTLVPAGYNKSEGGRQNDGRRRKDLAGKTFGKWTAVHIFDNRRWLCRCECGKEQAINTCSLIPKIRTHGCLKCMGKENSRIRCKDLVGLHFGRVTVLRELDRLTPFRRRFEVQCDCGSIFIANNMNLARGKQTRKASLCTPDNPCSTPGFFFGDNRYKDLIGRKFGEWTVIRFLKDGYWLCRCTCGKEQSILNHRLLTGKTSNCHRCMTIKPRSFSIGAIRERARRRGLTVAQYRAQAQT